MNVEYVTTIKIYGLFNPIENNYFYVGITSGELNRRLLGHMNSADKNERKVEVIKKIKSFGKRPIIHLLEKIEWDSTNRGNIKELEWIAKLSSQGHPLVNKSFSCAGRKPSGNPKVQITLFFEQHVIDKFGGVGNLKAKIYEWIDQYNKNHNPDYIKSSIED